MQVTWKDKIFQINDGFVVIRKGKIYHTDNDFNILNEYDFNADFVTFDGLVIDNFGLTLDVITGEIFESPEFDGMTEGHYLYMWLDDTEGKEIYDFKTKSWYNKLDAITDGFFVEYLYGKDFKTNIEDNFLRYIFINGKSILIYENHIEIYEGELHSLERLEDALHGKEKAYFNDEYATLIKIYDVAYSRDYPIKFLLNNLIFRNTTLDLTDFNLYTFTIDRKKILGVVNHDIITADDKINLRLKRKNLL